MNVSNINNNQKFQNTIQNNSKPENQKKNSPSKNRVPDGYQAALLVRNNSPKFEKNLANWEKRALLNQHDNINIKPEN